ncbi:hypothetical protein OAP75_03030 [Candidatus Pseudothioglobus singularis]|nr:hypothetical protein [Candidatus Pseudothioglobus singularis]
MEKINTYFVPLKISMLPEYLGSGFVGLTSSLEPDDDIQSLGFPKISVLDSIDQITHDVCLEITSVQIAIQAKKKTYKYLMLDGPIAISNIQKIIFFDQEEKDNFIASFSMLSDIPIDFFQFEVQKKSNQSKSSKAKPTKTKLNLSTLYLNQFTTLNIAIVELFKRLNIDFSYTAKTNNTSPFEICHDLIITVLGKIHLSKDIEDYEFQLLDLYICSLKKLGISEKNELINKRITSDELLMEMVNTATIQEPIKLNGHLEKINPIIHRILEKTQNILIGIELPSELSDKERVLQRALFIATITDTHDALEQQVKSLSVGKNVAALAEFLILFRQKINSIAPDLWKKNKEELNKYLSLSENIASTDNYSISSFIKQNTNDFGSQSKLRINHSEIASKEIKPDPELMIVVERLKSFKFNPKPGPNESIQINVQKNGFKVPITLSMMPCSVTKEKRNLIMNALIPNCSNLFDKKSSRTDLLEIIHYHMVSIGVVEKSLEISRSQLADTLDRDELQHHIELIAAAYTEILNKFSLK